MRRQRRVDSERASPDTAVPAEQADKQPRTKGDAELASGEEALRRRIDTVALASLPPVLALIAAVYVATGLATLAIGQLNHESGRAVIVSVNFSSAVILLMARLMLRRHRLVATRANMALVGLVALVCSTTLLRLYFTDDLSMLVIIGVVGIASGVFILSYAWFVVVQVIVLGAWITSFTFFPTSASIVRGFFGLTVAVAAAFFIRRFRVAQLRQELDFRHTIERGLAAARRAREAERAARVAAEEASHVKLQFLARISHELRTPMNAIIGMTRLLLNTPQTDEQREYSQAVFTASGGLLRLLNDLLDLSKINSGELTLERVSFTLDALLDELRDVVQRQAEQKGLRFVIVNDVREAMYLEGDPVRLRQILINLVGNAIKFTERGEVRITVRPLSLTEAQVTLRFEVKDTGVGIPPEVQGVIFSAYSQAESSTTRRFGGTGLGLAICNQLAEQMGGTIGVESEVGAGSLFWVEFPFPRSAEPGARLASVGHPLRLVRLPENTGERLGKVLVVDDNELNRRLLEIVLVRLGYDVTIANNGAEAVERASNGGYQVILMDVMMPTMDGLEATRRIRASERERGCARTPIVAMTAAVMAQELDKCTAAGMDNFVSKPIDYELFQEVLQKYTVAGA